MGYMCKKVLRDPKTKRPFQYRGVERTKKRCSEMSSCMGIVKVNCRKNRPKKLNLCVDILETDLYLWEHCVLKKERGKYDLSFYMPCDAFLQRSN